MSTSGGFGVISDEISDFLKNLSRDIAAGRHGDEFLEFVTGKRAGEWSYVPLFFKNNNYLIEEIQSLDDPIRNGYVASFLNTPSNKNSGRVMIVFHVAGTSWSTVVLRV